MDSINNRIGIVGGVGPYAGLELQYALLRHSDARRDRDYPPVVCISAPHEISDRTEFVLGETSVNPAGAIIDQIHALYGCGARFIGIPCNTAHAEKIFSVIVSGIRDLKDAVLVNMIDETFALIKREKPDVRTIGVLATKGSYKSKVFTEYGNKHRCEVIVPEDESLQDEIHRSIYDETYGIKALGYLHRKAQEHIDKAFEYYRRKKIDTVILGCTELSVVFRDESRGEFSLIDPVGALARKLILLQRHEM